MLCVLGCFQGNLCHTEMQECWSQWRICPYSAHIEHGYDKFGRVVYLLLMMGITTVRKIDC